MAEAAVTFLLEQLKEVVIWYRDLITGAENEFTELNNELASLNAFLKETAKKKKDHMFRELERKITNGGEHHRHLPERDHDFPQALPLLAH